MPITNKQVRNVEGLEKTYRNKMENWKKSPEIAKNRRCLFTSVMDVLRSAFVM